MKIQLGSSSILVIPSKKKKLLLLFGVLMTNIKLKSMLTILFLNSSDFTLLQISKVESLTQLSVSLETIATVSLMISLN